MSVELVCPGCQRLLHVSVEPSSQRARCPICSTLFDVSNGSVNPSPNSPDPPSPRWHVRIPEGLTFGPVSKEELDRWVAEGRVNAECQLRADEQTAWINADAIYRDFPSVAVRPESSPWQPARNQEPARFPQVTGRRTLEPHRGAVILALGILSWVSCPVFGLFAWILGSTDLSQMRAGRMEIDGLTLTQAGRLLGMIHVLLTIVVIGVVGSLFVLFGATMR